MDGFTYGDQLMARNGQQWVAVNLCLHLHWSKGQCVHTKIHTFPRGGFVCLVANLSEKFANQNKQTNPSANR